jgi:hypothetical protein
VARSTPEILKQFPHPATMRARIAALDAEATFLRRLLRMLLRCPPSAGYLPVGDDRARAVPPAGPRAGGNGHGKGVPHAD